MCMYHAHGHNMYATTRDRKSLPGRGRRNHAKTPARARALRPPLPELRSNARPQKPPQGPWGGLFQFRRRGRGGERPPRMTVSGARHGGVPKRSNGADCKSAGIAFGGSNPPPTIGVFAGSAGRAETMGTAGVAQLARASAFQAEGRGFESRLPLCRPAWAPEMNVRSGSSVVERVLGKDEVAGSIPAQSSRAGELPGVR